MKKTNIILALSIILLLIGTGLVVVSPHYTGKNFWSGIVMVSIGLLCMVWCITRKNFLK